MRTVNFKKSVRLIFAIKKTENQEKTKFLLWVHSIFSAIIVISFNHFFGNHNILTCTVYFINEQHGFALKLQISHGVLITQVMLQWIVIELRTCYFFVNTKIVRWKEISFDRRLNPRNNVQLGFQCCRQMSTDANYCSNFSFVYYFQNSTK